MAWISFFWALDIQGMQSWPLTLRGAVLQNTWLPAQCFSTMMWSNHLWDWEGGLISAHIQICKFGTFFFCNWSYIFGSFWWASPVEFLHCLARHVMANVGTAGETGCLALDHYLDSSRSWQVQMIWCLKLQLPPLFCVPSCDSRWSRTRMSISKWRF